ncbi:MAG TPA: hypothetical protein VNO33_13580 [Kofleriaceae bacterium]|nr:hypothetical protein [Kofleriaceae bacterium]
MLPWCAGALVAAILIALGCAGAEPRGLAPAARQAGAAPSLQRACELADRRCARCHPIDRVLTAHVSGPEDWSSYVRRMRLTPGSGISKSEEPVIVRCLVQHSFGDRQ